jgi:hypothetical protein
MPVVAQPVLDYMTGKQEWCGTAFPYTHIITLSLKRLLKRVKLCLTGRITNVNTVEPHYNGLVGAKGFNESPVYNK